MKKDLYSMINEAYTDEDYKRALRLIEMYISDSNNGIFYSLLSKYINCVFIYDDLKKGERLLDTMEALYPGVYPRLTLVRRYIRCGNISKAEEIIRNNVFTEEDYYNIALSYMDINERSKAEKYLIYAKATTNDQSLIYKINSQMRKLNNEDDRKISYQYYKSKGNSLRKGDIVYVKGIDIYLKKEDGNYKKRPYLIWKVEDNGYKALPLSLNPESFETDDINTFINSQGNICAVLPKVVKLKEEDIDICAKPIAEEKVDDILLAMYLLAIEEKTTEEKKTIESFLKEYTKNMDITEKSLIRFTNSNNDDQWYYLYQKPNSGYKLIKIDDPDNLQVTIPKIIKFKKNKYPTEVIELEEYQIERIERQLKTILEPKLRIGSIVEYDHKELVIVRKNREEMLGLKVNKKGGYLIPQSESLYPSSRFRIIGRYDEDELQQKIEEQGIIVPKLKQKIIKSKLK